MDLYISKFDKELIEFSTSLWAIAGALTNPKVLFEKFKAEINVSLFWFSGLIAKYPIPFYLGGTSILIVVVVAMDTVTQVQTRLMSSQYESLIRKTKFGK